MKKIKTKFDEIFKEISKVVVGQEKVIKQMMIAIACDSNALVEGSRYAGSGQPIITNFQAQTLAETIIFSSAILCGTLGFVFISRATKQVTKGRMTASYIISGLSLALIGLIIGFFLITLKGG